MPSVASSVRCWPASFFYRHSASAGRWCCSPFPFSCLASAALASIALVTLTEDFEHLYPHAVIRRDYTATVIAAGEGMQKQLLVNGIGMTNLTPITKMMAHMPLASLDRPARKVLVICFGMGTSYRSSLSWGPDVTAVDLIPSVPQLLGYFHADGDELLKSPRGTI